MTKTADSELFERLSSQFEGLAFTDEELRLKRFHVSDPRDDSRYEAGAPPADVSLAGFEFFYEIPSRADQQRNELTCMFGNHRHLSGAAFIFSDGKVRCVGRHCFSELAEHTGKDVYLIRRMVRSLTERQGHLRWFDDARQMLPEELEKLRSAQFVAECEAHDAFFDSLRSVNGPALSFAMTAASNHGRVPVIKTREVKGEDGKTRLRRETFILDLPSWQLFASVPSLRYLRGRLESRLALLLRKLQIATRDVTPQAFKGFKGEVRAIKEDIGELEKRFELMRAFSSQENLSRFAELWNARATPGYELRSEAGCLISGAENVPTRIPLAA